MKSEAQDGQTEGSGGAGYSKKPGPLRYLQPVVDKWSVRERLALATAVTQDNDKHWPSISKLVKPFASEKRSDDYFAPRKCARQYADLLENIEQPKRRGEAAVFDCTPEEMLVKRLTLDRIEELQSSVKKLQEDYERVKSEISSIKNGSIDNKTLTRMYNDLKESEKQSAPSVELIPVTQSDLERITADADNKEVTKKPEVDSTMPSKEVMDSNDFGLPVDEDYDKDSARIDESRREVLLAIAGSQEIKREISHEEQEEDNSVQEKESSRDSQSPVKIVAGGGQMELKQEVEAAEETSQPAEESPKRVDPPVKELAPAQSPSSSSTSSPMCSVRPPPASSDAEADAEDDDVDDEATEGEEEDEEGSRSSSHPVDEKSEKSYRTWKKSINMIIRAAQSHKHASVFLSPVTDDIAAGYSQVINRPMDLSTIKRRVDNGEIRTTAEFQRDVMLMFTNAVMYNNAEHDVHKMALEMYDDVMYHIEQYLSTQVMSPSVESKVLRRRVSDHNEDEQTSRRRRCSADSDKRDEQAKKSRK